MGIKCKAVLASLFLLLFIGSMWLQGALEKHLDSCIQVYSQKRQPHHLTNESGLDGDESTPLRECPNQRFQVSQLLFHLHSAPESSSDVLLEPYLSSWDELIKFMEALGPMVGLISQEIEAKTSLIRELARREEDLSRGGSLEGERASKEVEAARAYHSVHSMIQAELLQGLVDFHQQTASGCRTLLRLHRALLWLQRFLEKLMEVPERGHLRSPSELCREAYQQTLAPHHSWFVQRAAEVAFIAMPERAFFYQLMCVQTQQEAGAVLSRVVRAIGEVYNRTQETLEEHGMLNLP